MATPAVTPDRLISPSLVAGAAGCLIALGLGAVAAAGQGAVAAAVILALVVFCAGVAVYVRDPVRALIWLWVIVLADAPLTTLAGTDSPLGRKVSQADELFVLLLVVLTIGRTIRTNTRIPLRVLLPATGVLVCGLIGAVIHQVPLSVALPAAWLGMKLWIMIGVALLLPWRPEDIPRIYRATTTVGVVLAAFGFIDFLSGGAVAHAIHLVAYTPAAGKARADSISSTFGGPNGYSLFMSILFAFAFTHFAAHRKRSDLILALVFALSVLLTLRLKGFMSLAAVVLIVTIVQRRVFGRTALPVVLVGLTAVGGVFALESSVISNQFSLYTSSEATARAQLYLTSEKIGVDDFPFGVGFGRFASYESRLNYSPVYDQYGLSSYYGLSRTDPRFIDDTAWPSVLGEDGFAGLAIYAVGIVLLGMAIIRRLRNASAAMRWAPLAALCTLAVMLTDSLGDPTLFDWVPAITFALVFGPAMIATKRAEATQPARVDSALPAPGTA